MTFQIRVPAERLACMALAVLAAGCASRSTPASYPANAALSPAAPEARPAHVTVALHREPPLPGESSAGWAGLAPSDPAHSEPTAHDHAAMGHDHAAMEHSTMQDGGADAAH